MPVWNIPVLKFDFLHLQGRCTKCGLITHAGVVCTETPRAAVARNLNFGGVIPTKNFAFKTGSSAGVPQVGSSSPPASAAAPLKVKKKAKIMLRRRGSSSSACDTVDDEHEIVHTEELASPALASVEVEASQASSPAKTSKKRDRGGGLSPSPKKLKTIFGGKPMILRPESLGLIEVDDGEETLISLKKKLGRPYGSETKNSANKAEKKKKPDTMRPSFPAAQAVQLQISPNSKGKDKV